MSVQDNTMDQIAYDTYSILMEVSGIGPAWIFPEDNVVVDLSLDSNAIEALYTKLSKRFGVSLQENLTEMSVRELVNSIKWSLEKSVVA